MSTAALSSKERGNTAFKQGDFSTAVREFTAAIRLNPDDAVLYSNRSAAYASVHMLDEALADAECCIQLNPSFAKGYSRKGMAEFGKGDFWSAQTTYTVGLRIDPNNAAMQLALAEVESKLKRIPMEPNTEAESGMFVGIDLGTANSVLSRLIIGEKKQPQFDVMQVDGSEIIPSVVAFVPRAATSVDTDPLQRALHAVFQHINPTSAGCSNFFSSFQILVGEAAQQQATSNPRRTIYDAKRLIGQPFTSDAVQANRKLLPYTIINGPDGLAYIEIRTDADATGCDCSFSITPDTISALLLVFLKYHAQAYFKQTVKGAVISIPAYFNRGQYRCTAIAAERANLRCLRLVCEPTCAAATFACMHATRYTHDSTVVVYDLGGGTLDVSILVLEDSVCEVKATTGDPQLGGADIDQIMLEFCVLNIKQQHDIDISTNPYAMRELKTQCEAAKRILSKQRSCTIHISSTSTVVHQSYSVNLTRTELENLCQSFLARCTAPVHRAMKDGRLRFHDVDHVILVGGASRTPFVRTKVLSMFSERQIASADVISPELAISQGASIQAAIVSFAVDMKDFLLIDVVPMSLGVETNRGIMHNIIRHNDTMPLKQSQLFTTVHDNQCAVYIEVYEGEHARTISNRPLAAMLFDGLTPMPRGVPRIEVTFNLDANNTFIITVREQYTARAKTVTMDVLSAEIAFVSAAVNVANKTLFSIVAVSDNESSSKSATSASPITLKTTEVDAKLNVASASSSEHASIMDEDRRMLERWSSFADVKTTASVPLIPAHVKTASSALPTTSSSVLPPLRDDDEIAALASSSSSACRLDDEILSAIFHSCFESYFVNVSLQLNDLMIGCKSIHSGYVSVTHNTKVDYAWKIFFGLAGQSPLPIPGLSLLKLIVKSVSSAREEYLVAKFASFVISMSEWEHIVEKMAIRMVYAFQHDIVRAIEEDDKQKDPTRRSQRPLRQRMMDAVRDNAADVLSELHLADIHSSAVNELSAMHAASVAKAIMTQQLEQYRTKHLPHNRSMMLQFCKETTTIISSGKAEVTLNKE